MNKRRKCDVESAGATESEFISDSYIQSCEPYSWKMKKGMGENEYLHHTRDVFHRKYLRISDEDIYLIPGQMHLSYGEDSHSHSCLSTSSHVSGTVMLVLGMVPIRSNSLSSVNSGSHSPILRYVVRVGYWGTMPSRLSRRQAGYIYYLAPDGIEKQLPVFTCAMFIYMLLFFFCLSRFRNRTGVFEIVLKRSDKLEDDRVAFS